MNLETIGIVLLLCIPFFIMTIWAVVNAGQKDFETSNKKLFWLLIASIPFIGFIVYFLFGAKKGAFPDQK